MLKKLLAFFEVVLVVALIILIIAIFTFYMSFSKENSLPSVFGNSFFILNTDDMQNENGTGINKGALVIASDNELDSLKEGMVVLCDINDIETAEPVYNVLRIYTIEPNSESTLYTVSNEKMASNRTYIIGKDKIVAKCTYSSDTLGQIIAFSKTTNGIVTLIILPCVILIALQIVHLVARAKRNKFEQIELEEFEFPSDMTFPDDEQSPLYNVAKHDFADKVNVEDNFANKNEKQDKKSKKKTSKADKQEDAKTAVAAKTSSKSDADKALKMNNENGIKSKKDNRKAVAVKVDETDNSKDEAKSNEKVEIVADKDADSVENTAKSEIAVKFSEKTDNNDKKSETAKAFEQISDADDNNSTTVKNDVDANNEIANESETKENSVVEDKGVSEISEKTEAIENETENSTSTNDNANVKNENTKTDDKSECAVKSATDAAKPKKKTTVKKRTVVKKTSSTSATDLLKAIDSESKKLQ